MTENKTDPETRAEYYYPSEDFISKSRVKSKDEYQRLYERSIGDPEGFWAEMAEDLTWIKKWDRVMNCDFHEGRVRWFEGGIFARPLYTIKKKIASLLAEGFVVKLALHPFAIISINFK